ncbi:MAG: phytanoyl-CoA dioxygenase family protein, partial [Abditibacteriaceae bacterium]
IWMPLQEATLENGCMQFIPGSHKLEVLPHQSIGNDPRVHGLEVCAPNNIDFSKAVPCPIPAGGATLHPGRTLHYAGANKSSEPRRALIFGFSLTPIPHQDDRRFPWNEIKTTARAERAETPKATP